MQQPVHRALILAAGRGNRLMPLTANCPKPMVALDGKPMLERILLAMRSAGIDEATIVHGYLGEVIESYFGTGERVGMRINYRAQVELTGTAGAMLLAEQSCGAEPFLLHWGDILVDPRNYREILGIYNDAEVKPGCVLGMNYVEDPYAGGAVYLEGDRVAAVAEKPAKGTAGTHWNIGGVILFDAVIWQYLQRTQAPESGEYYITAAIDLMAREKAHAVLPYELVGERIHLTDPASVEALQDDPRLAKWEG